MSRKRSSNHWPKCVSNSSIEAMFSEERDETCAVEGRLAQTVCGPLDQGQHLGAALAQGDEHAPARRQLLDQGWRDLGSACGNEDGIVRRIRAPAERAVAHEDRDVLHRGGP